MGWKAAGVPSGPKGMWSGIGGDENWRGIVGGDEKCGGSMGGATANGGPMGGCASGPMGCWNGRGAIGMYDGSRRTSLSSAYMRDKIAHISQPRNGPELG